LTLTFITVFKDKTKEKHMQEISHYFIENVGSDIDYDKLTEFAHDITGAFYTAFNLIDKENNISETVSLRGLSNHTEKLSDFLGFNIVEKNGVLIRIIKIVIKIV
jgi:hypothetical protein